VVQDTGAQCEYVDHETKKRCESRGQIEIDHVQPRAFGGGDERANLRVLCRQHNLLAAERSLGVAKMEKFSRAADR
jgi:5-methylcytosine-specific restriction endonuclease McrA